jgi:hypothetical protein
LSYVEAFSIYRLYDKVINSLKSRTCAFSTKSWYFEEVGDWDICAYLPVFFTDFGIDATD